MIAAMSVAQEESINWYDDSANSHMQKAGITRTN